MTEINFLSYFSQKILNIFDKPIPFLE